MTISQCIKGREDMTENIIIKSSVQKRFDSFIAHGRVLFFSAPCGFGKTVLADALLRGRNVLRQSAADPDCAIPPSAQDWDILLIDDLQLMQEEAGQQALCELIRSSPERRFVLLSRGVPPGCLTAFQYTGLMTVLEADDLLFDADDVRRLFQLSGANVTDSEIDGILKESVGYPLGVAITARCMSPDKPWTPELVARVFHEVFLYFETAIYRRFDLPVRHFLLELAPFESFDLEMARMVSGDPHAGERLDWLLRYTTMLRYDDCQRFHFWSGFRAFLLWEMEREYTEEKRKALFSRGGLYYELKEDYAHALECYTSGGDHSKVSELLVRNAELHPGMGHYAEMEKYYRSLPEAEILASPSLMQGMSMFCALAMDYAGSERWYGELQAFAERCGRQDAAGKQARSRLAWLDISLPQRGVNGLTETIPAVFRLLMNKEVTLPSFSVTSALPSIMNGGKDFSPWSKKDDLLYKTLRLPVEAVLGRDGVGLADCAIAESKFEKGEDVCSGTSKANSGIAHAGFDAVPGSWKAKMNIRGSQMMEELSRKLDFPYKRNGSLVLCFDEKDRPRLEKLLQQGKENGVEGLEILEKKELLALEPALSEEVVCALHAPTGGIVCPFKLTIALAENAAVNGVEFHLNEGVKRVQPGTVEGYTVETGKGTYETRIVVNAAGLYGDEIHNQVSGEKLHITSRKGEYCLMDKKVGQLVSHTIFQMPTAMGKGVLVTPTVHGNLMVGPTATDISDKEGVDTTAEGLDEVLKKAALSVKSLPRGVTITSFAGLRAHEDHDDFILGEVKDAPGFFDAVGIESPGLTSAPAIGEWMAEKIVEKLRKTQKVDEKKDFQETRKDIPNIASMDQAEAAALIAENPAYGTIICRCEKVTEGEIIDAIRRPLGARSLDGIKRRTRAGMGRCQAGFCSTKVMDILARELGIPLEEVTKAGGASRMLTGGER